MNGRDPSTGPFPPPAHWARAGRPRSRPPGPDACPAAAADAITAAWNPTTASAASARKPSPAPKRPSLHLPQPFR